MSFGTKVDSVHKLKKSLEKSSSGGDSDAWIKYVPKDSDLTVRFLTEPDEWVKYEEAWDDDARRGKGGSFPVPDDMQLDPDVRVSVRYLASALNMDDDRVIPVCLPKSLMTQVVSRYDRYGTMVDRDYTLSKTGKGLDTTYLLDPEPPLARKLDKYQQLDLEAVLAGAYQSYRSELDPTADDGEDDEIPVHADDDPDGPDASTALVADEADDTALTAEELEEQPIASLRVLARAQKIDPRGMSKADLVIAITGADAF